MRLPALVMHADWGAHPRNRWQAAAVLQADGRYRLLPTARIGPLADFWRSLAATEGRVLLGFDFPLGLPAAYAACAEIDDFAEALPRFGNGRFASFYVVADRPDEISLTRPFFPDRPDGGRRQQLLAGLKLERWCQLLRWCDRRTAIRNAACALFWTLGGSQVGKAAIAGWRDLLAPAVRDGVDLGIWPFQGGLEELIERRHFTIAETYPAEVYGHLGISLRRRGGKRSQNARRAVATQSLAELDRLDVTAEAAARAETEDGFGTMSNGEDRFDAMVGLLGMLLVLRRQRGSGEPDDPVVRRVEGWILGQQG
jgi:hypothetical protein